MAFRFVTKKLRGIGFAGLLGRSVAGRFGWRRRGRRRWGGGEAAVAGSGEAFCFRRTVAVFCFCFLTTMSGEEIYGY